MSNLRADGRCCARLWETLALRMDAKTYMLNSSRIVFFLPVVSPPVPPSGSSTAASSGSSSASSPSVDMTNAHMQMSMNAMMEHGGGDVNVLMQLESPAAKLFIGTSKQTTRARRHFVTGRISRLLALNLHHAEYALLLVCVQVKSLVISKPVISGNYSNLSVRY